MRVFGKEVSPGVALIGAAGIGFLLYSGGKLAFAAVNAKFLNYNLKALNLDQSSISIEIVNPTPSQYTIQSLNLDIYDNDNRIATANYIGQLIIAPKGSTILNLKITLDPAGLTDEIFTEGLKLYKENSTDAQNITATGSAQVDSIMLPVNMKLGTLPAEKNIF